MAKSFEYYVRQVSDVRYEVAKFSNMSGGEQPLAVYNVIYDPSRGRGRCDCPAGTYRGTGMQDKHVQMVKQWIEGGRRVLAIIS